MWSGSLAAIDKGLIVNRLSKIIGLDSKEINTELQKRIDRAARAASYNAENRKVQRMDLGSGLLAAAQREILEVLLNEPGLFETVGEKVAVEDFDVPVLRRTASILFEVMNTKAEVRLADILTRAESPQESSLIVQLAQSGEAKGNFESRLAGALDAIERHRAQTTKSGIKAIEDKRQFLQRVFENTGKQNPHSAGMR